ncbi:hypothetical protein BN1723_006369 [Verticillium longisporum]|uniref:E3 ubiquitin-protein ligase listerin n=1 Tax=Verticillium longisporum TaxID=100787 RepID=A0A0G4NES1_VERLO|nr:hypothetical protein BN1723_006369 [Verticillium longisporum]
MAHWPAQGLPTDWLQRHREISPNTPFTIVEFQGGGFQPWGGAGFESCAGLLNHEFERVLFKHAYAAGATVFNVYMTWGGTNWGNLGHSDGYTSYDYGAQITEERLVNREKYSESKLQANFFHVSPAYLEAERHFASLDWTDNAAITVTPATTNTTKFYFTRHTQYSSLETVAYKLTVDTVEYGNLTVPQLSESLFLTRRDSKIHVSDYAVGDKTLVYSTAEIFTWKQYKDKTVLVVYGGPNEHHELAVEGKGDAEVIEGSDVETDQKDGYTILNWEVTEDRKVVRVHKDLYVYILNRNEAYNYWVPPTEADLGTADVIVKAGYLVRTVSIDGSSLSFVGDVNATTPIEVIGGAPTSLKALEFNGKALDFEQDDSGVVSAVIEFETPGIKLPCLSRLKWKYLDSLPEIQSDYSDDAWLDADKDTLNIANPLDTPKSLYGGDYGFHTGSLLFRGRFTANGEEASSGNALDLTTQGGNAYGTSVWLNDQFIGSWVGNAVAPAHNSTFDLPKLTEGEESYDLKVADSEPEEKNLHWLLVHLYYLTLKYIPGLFRAWYIECRSKQTKIAVEAWMIKYFSPLIISEVLDEVAVWASSQEAPAADENELVVKVSPTAKEITAGYEVDESLASIAIRVPAGYPLEGVNVVGLNRVAVNERKWQSWLMTTQGVITFSNGSIIDGLTTFRRNIVGALKGQSECAICYSIISTDKKMPDKKCSTCKNLFHRTCLYKWFQSSNQNTCPLCRNPIDYLGSDVKTRRAAAA